MAEMTWRLRLCAGAAVLALAAMAGGPASAQTTVEWGSGCGGHWLAPGQECRFNVLADPVAFGGVAHAAAIAHLTVQLVELDGETVVADCVAIGILTTAECGDVVFTGRAGSDLICRVTGNDEGIYGCASDP